MLITRIELAELIQVQEGRGKTESLVLNILKLSYVSLRKD